MGNTRIFVSFGLLCQKLKTDSAEAIAGSMLNIFFQVNAVDTMLNIKKTISHYLPRAHFLLSFRNTNSLIMPRAHTAAPLNALRKT